MASIVLTPAQVGRWFYWTGAYTSGFRPDGEFTPGGMRFTGVDLPQGMEIEKATLWVLRDQATTSQVNFTISAFAYDNAPTFQNNYHDNPRGSASVSATSSAKTWPFDDMEEEWDVTPLIQEVVNRSGWQPGNALALYFEASSDFLAVSGGSNDPTLTIEYSDPAEGEAHFAYQLGISATGEAPVVPVREGQAHFRYQVDYTATGEMPPAPGARGEAHFTYDLNLNARGTAPAKGQAKFAYGIDVSNFAVRDSLASADFEYNYHLSLTSSIPPTPPPPPWEEVADDPRYIAALTARHATIDARVEIIDLDGTVIESLGGPDATLPGVVSGSVGCNSASRSWWTCNLQIDNSDLLPTVVGDLLHPLSHNRIRVWWRIRLAPGTWAEIPVGTYFIQWPEAVDDGGAEISLAVEGRDATAELSRAQMQTSMELGGRTVKEAVEAILDEYAPWADYSIEDTDHRLPGEYHAGEPGADPLTVIREIARTTGMIVHADRMGRIVGRRPPERMTSPVAEFTEGPLCAVTSAGVSVPLDKVANRVKVVSTAREDADGEEIDPIFAVAQVDDETSPLWVGHGFYYDHYTETDAVTTEAQAMSMAKGILTDKTTLVEDIELVIFPHPHLDPFDTVATTAGRVGITGYQEVKAFALTLGDLGGQRLTLSGRREI